MSAPLHIISDEACVAVKNLPDEDLILLLRATEDEIEAHGELNELRELLLDCTIELLNRPALLKLEMARATDN